MKLPSRPLIELCRVYRDAHARYTLAFARGDVNSIEEALSRMQEIGRAFQDGARWAESESPRKRNSR